MPKRNFASLLRLSLLFVLVAWMTLQPQFSVKAVPVMSIEPITWNVIGLDSNNVNVGPNHFPVGARVCNTSTAGETLTNVKSAFVFNDGANPYTGNAYINLRSGTLSAYTANGINLSPGACTDFYYEVAVTRTSSAYNQTRNYHITATSDQGASASTPTPRTLIVEYLVSQNRNAVTDVQYGTSIASLSSVAPGGTMTMMVGNTYYIRLIGYTATQGYEQLESFINIPNTIFQVLSVSTTYTADSSATVSSPNDKAYGNACVWENDPASPNYLSCLSTGKVGGNITVTYQVKILQVPAAPLVNPAPLSTLIYDFSGSSFHYNADYGFSTRFANIVNASIIKSFSPKTVNPGDSSTLTFTVNNPGPAVLSGVNFADNLPSGLTISSTTVTYSGCGTPSPASLTVGATSVSFSNITVAGLGTCTVAVNVSAAADGTYNNTSNNLFINTNQDTGSFATDTMVVSSRPPAPSTCASPATLATWTMPAAGQGSGGPPPPFTSKAANVATATTSNSGGASSIVAGAATNAWQIQGGWQLIQSAPTSTTTPYFQFTLDTSNYGGVSINFDFLLSDNGDWAAAGNNFIYIHTLADSGSFSTLTPVTAAKGSWTALGTARTASSTGVGTTTFRINVLGAPSNKPDAKVTLDNIVISGCPRPIAPTLGKGFLTSPIPQGGISTLQFTFTNPNGSALTGVGFTDTLPLGLTVATPNGLTTSCTTGTFTGATSTAASGTRSVSVSGGTLSANANCTISVNVLGNVAGQYTNVSSPITSTETGPNTSGTGFGTASLTVVAPPSINKSFTANPIFTGSTTTLIFSITNPNSASALTGISFTDTLPAGLTVGDSSTAQCGGTLTTTAATGVVALVGSSLAAGASCTFGITVTGAPTGLKTNSVTVSSTNGGTGNTSTANVLVKDPAPAINMLKQVGPSDTGPWTPFLSVTLPASVYYRLVVENVGDVPLSSVNVTDPSVSTAGCSWVDGDGTTLTPPFTLPVANANDDQIAFCVLGPVAATSGSNSNTATATGSYSGSTVTDTSTATYGTTGLTLAKSVTQTSFTSAGETLNYSYLVTNSGFAPLLGPVTVTDDKASVTCPAVTTVGDGDNYLDLGESLTCSATYTVTAGDATAGFVTNTASASAGGITSNTDSETVYQVRPDLTVAKTDNVSGSVPQNGTFDWTITVTNSGTATASFADTNVIMSDPLPGVAGYYPQGALIVANGATPPTGIFNCSISGTALSCVASGAVTMPVGASFSVTFAVAPTAAGSLANTATADPNGNVTEGDETNNSGSNTVTVLAPPSISKSFGASTFALGGTTSLSFTITNPNTGTALTGVAVSDVLPAGLTVADGIFSVCGGTSNLTTTALTGTVALIGGSAPAGGSCAFSVTVTGATAGVKDNTTGSVTSTNGGTGNTASASTTVVIPDLTVSKVNNVSGTVAQNGTFDWTVTVTNSGTSTASFADANVIVSDPLPGAAGYYPQGALTVTNGATPPTGTIVCSISGTALSCPASGAVTLPAGASFSVTFAVSPTAAGSLANTATVDPGGSVTEGDETNNTGSDTVTVQSPSIVLTKTPTLDDTVVAPSDVANAGDTITYTFSVENSGNVTLTGITVSDPLLPSLSCTIASLAPGATSSCTASGNVYTLTQADVNAGSRANTATVTGTPPSGPDVTDTNTQTTTLPSLPSIVLTKTPVPTTVTAVGDVVTYGFSVQNTGNVTLTNVTLSDTLLSGLTCTPIASLAPAATQAFDCTGNTYAITQADLDTDGGGDGDIDNTATATGTPPGGGTTSDTDSAAVTLPAQNPAINIVKSPATQTVTSGGTANFTLTLTNTGNVTLSGIVVTDALCTTGPTFTGGDTNTDSELQITETWTYSCTVDNVTADFTNTASVSTTEDATDSDSADVTVTLLQADLSLDKSVSNSTPLVATNIDFTLSVTNGGPDTATNVEVTDVLPAGFAYVTHSATQGTYDDGTGVWDVGTLLLNQTGSLTITVTVNITGPYTNYAEITASDVIDPDSTPDNDSTDEDDDDSVTVTPIQTSPSLGKSVSNSNQAFTTSPSVAIGEIVEYTVTVNVPPGIFANARLVDSMERGLSFVACSSITASDPALTTDVAGSFSGVCSSPTVDDAGGGTTVDVARRVTFDLGTVTNASGADQTLTFIYNAVVLNNAGNVSGTGLDNSAVWVSDSGSQPPAVASLLIVEPDLSIAKTANTSLVSVGSEITITLTIQHTANSEVNAYDASVTDILPAELELVPGTLECVSGAQDATTCAYNAGTRTVNAIWNTFIRSGGDGRVSFRIRVVSLPAGGINNVANVAWTSLPGDVSTPQNGNTFSTERDYDPASQIDVYGANATLVIGVFNSAPATGFAPNEVTDLRGTPQGFYAQTGGLTVEIPSLGVSIPIVGVPLRNGEWNVSWLGNQAGWLEGSAFPSWSGNSVLTGHVYGANGLPGPFVDLGRLKYGDKIIIRAYGQTFTYEVRANVVVEPSDASIFRHEGKSWLTLVTCKEYDEKTKTYRKRVVVRAVLVNVSGK